MMNLVRWFPVDSKNTCSHVYMDSFTEMCVFLILLLLLFQVVPLLLSLDHDALFYFLLIEKAFFT